MLSTYSTIPYVERGRDFSGADCWGFVRLQCINEDQIPPDAVPSFGALTGADPSGMTDAYRSTLPAFKRVARPLPGAVACCFDGRGNFRHVGRVWRDGSRLVVSHTRAATGPLKTDVREFCQGFKTVEWWVYVR